MIKAKGCCCCCWAGWRAGGRQSSSIRKTLQWSCGRRLNKEILCGGRSVCAVLQHPPPAAPTATKGRPRSRSLSHTLTVRVLLRLCNAPHTAAGGRAAFSRSAPVHSIYTLCSGGGGGTHTHHCCMHPFRHATRPPPFIFNRLAATRPAVLAH